MGKPVNASIGDANLEALTGKTACRRKADACGSACYNRYGVIVKICNLHIFDSPDGCTLKQLSIYSLRPISASPRLVAGQPHSIPPLIP